MAADIEYQDVIAFLEIGNQTPPKKVPRRIGSAWINRDGKVAVRLQMIPVPGNGWDGSLLIEKRQEQQDYDDPQAERQNGRQSQPQPSRGGQDPQRRRT